MFAYGLMEVLTTLVTPHRFLNSDMSFFDSLPDWLFRGYGLEVPESLRLFPSFVTGELKVVGFQFLLEVLLRMVASRQGAIISV